MKINITDKASQQLKNMQQEQEQTSKKIRIMLTGIGWGGPRFDVALDEPTENDKSFKTDDFEFIVEPRLANYADSLTIDYRDSFLSKGFRVYLDSQYSGLC